jgi:hypothetical protein
MKNILAIALITLALSAAVFAEQAAETLELMTPTIEILF